MEFDLIVIGLGPAGSTAALTAARLGLNVLALDRADFPRVKTCGGGLSPRVLRFFETGEIPALERRITRLRLSLKDKKAFFSFREPIAYMVMRDRFDHALVTRAEQAGAVIKTGVQVYGISESPRGIQVETAYGRFLGKTALGADGALGVTARFLNPGNIERGMPGIEGEVRGGEMIDRDTIEIEVGAIGGGYGWLFPKKEGFSMGGAAMTKNRALRKDYKKYAELKGAGIGEGVSETGHPLPLHSNNREFKRQAGRFMLAGDAARLADPFFGEGIYYAMRSGEMAGIAAAGFINKKISLSAYEAGIRKEFYFELRAARRLAGIVYRFPGLFFRLASRYPYVLEHYAEVLRGKRLYRNFIFTFLWTGLRRKLSGGKRSGLFNWG